MAKTAVISNIRKNIMGTISFDFLGANIRKAQNFCTYPIDNINNTIAFQSDKRWMELNLEKRELRISKKGGNSWLYSYYGSDVVEIETEQIETLLDAIRGTSSIEAGKKENGIIQCDNGAAHLI